MILKADEWVNEYYVTYLHDVGELAGLHNIMDLNHISYLLQRQIVLSAMSSLLQSCDWKTK